ncbi:MAG: HAD hydrolase family protein, partial [Victivallales bacterium]|nr:HAD hydrolase family protein [Victivallales bacterium]
MKYTLLATDMDGTVVNSQNRISPRVEQAIHEALAAGYEVL